MTRRITYRNVEYRSLAALARAHGLKPDTLRHRLDRRHMTLDAAVEQPLMSRRQAARYGLAVRRARGEKIGIGYGRCSR